jgi:putative transposase
MRKGLRKNNREENFASGGAPTRAQIAALQVGSIRPALVSMHGAVHNTLNFQRHLISRSALRIFRAEAAAEWQEAVTAA